MTLRMVPRALWALLALLLALAGGALSMRFSSTPPDARKAAPEAVVTTVRGERLRLSDLRGKVVLVNFWATDCAICLREMPALVRTHLDHAQQGLETLAVAMAHDDALRVAQYARATALPFRVGLDSDGSVARAFDNVRATPTAFVLDRKGRVVQRLVGEPDFGKLAGLLSRLLAEPA